MRTKPTAPSTAGERGTWQLCRSVSPRCGTAGLRPPRARLLRPHNGLGSSVGSPIPWGIAGIPCTLPGPSRAGLEPRAAVGPAGPGHGGFLLAGEEWVPGERVAGSALHPGLVGASHRPHPCGTALPWVPSTPSPPPLPAKAAAGADAAGTADCPRHLPDRHRSQTHPARRAVQPLQRDLQPVLLQVQHQPRRPAPTRGQEQAPRRHHAPSQLGWVGRLPTGQTSGWGRVWGWETESESATGMVLWHQEPTTPHPLPFQLPAPHPPFPGSLLPGERCGSRPFPTCKGGLEGWLGRQRVHGAWENAGGGMGTELSPPEQRQRRSSQLQHCPCAGGLQHLGLPHGPTVFPLPLST